MKFQEIILDILGLGLFLFSIYGYYYLGADFIQGTIIGCAGLSLFVLKGSAIRKYIQRMIEKKLNK